MTEPERGQPDDWMEMLTNWLKQPSDPNAQIPFGAGQTARRGEEDQRRSVQEHLTGKTTFERVEAEYSYLIDESAYRGSRAEWTELTQEWSDFKSVFIAGDELWEFCHVESFGGPFCSGEEGLAVVRRGKVVAWKTMVVIS